MANDGTPASPEERIARELARVRRGGAEKYHQKNAEQGKLFARERLRLLLDEGSLLEDGALANAQDPELPADGVVTGLGTIDGRPVAVMANDSTVKAGSWGFRTVEKIIRIQEVAARERVPLFYLVDSAGARITDQIEMFPGRRGAGGSSTTRSTLSGVVPQICLLFGPSAAGGAYIPAFCDVVFMVNGNASMYLGSPRMAEMVIGEKVSLEEMGGARMHCSVSGCGDVLCQTEEEAIAGGAPLLRLLPAAATRTPPRHGPAPCAEGRTRPGSPIVPHDQNRPFDILQDFIGRAGGRGLLLRGEEALRRGAGHGTGPHRRASGGHRREPAPGEGRGPLRRLRRQGRPVHLALRRLRHPAPVPLRRSRVHDRHQGRAGRHHPAGAKMISAVSEATVPRGLRGGPQGLRRRPLRHDGPGFAPSTPPWRLPQAMHRGHGAGGRGERGLRQQDPEKPEDERAAYVQALRDEYKRDIDIEKLASELIIDAIVPGAELRHELARRFQYHSLGYEPPATRKRAVLPV